MATRHERTARTRCTHLQLPFEVSSAAVARKHLTTELRQRQWGESLIFDAELVLGELAANGLEHGRPNADGMVEISWCIETDLVRISVCDGGRPVDLTAGELSHIGVRGRGLAIVDHLCQTWTVDTANGLRVTAELRREPVGDQHP